MEPEEELHSFPYEASIEGVEHHYRITEYEEGFGVEQDGTVIATVQNVDGHWQQRSGEKLVKTLFDSICDHIESYYS